jgi:hypothetical protein
MSYLYDVLRSYYEIRSIDADDKSHQRVRPVSFKTCPPNFYLNGMTVSAGVQSGRTYHNSEVIDEVPKILGISKLHCKRIESRVLAIAQEYGEEWNDYNDPDLNQTIYPVRQTLDVPLAADSGTSYSLSGEPFSLDVHIGSPTLQPATPTWKAIKEHRFNCPSVEVEGMDGRYPTTVTGLTYNLHSDGAIDQLRLICGLAPGLTKVTSSN